MPNKWTNCLTTQIAEDTLTVVHNTLRTDPHFARVAPEELFFRLVLLAPSEKVDGSFRVILDKNIGTPDESGPENALTLAVHLWERHEPGKKHKKTAKCAGTKNDGLVVACSGTQSSFCEIIANTFIRVATSLAKLSSKHSN